MFKVIKNFNWIVISSVSCIFLGILTISTFVNASFIPLTDTNLQTLLIIDIILLIVFFSLIFNSLYRLYYTGKKNKIGSQTNLKYISLFSLFTFIPSLLIAIFSLFIFNFGIQNYFDKQITNAVNKSYEVAKNYLEESKKNVKSDIILMSVGLNRSSSLFYSNPKRFQQVIRAEKILRRIDDVYLIDGAGNVLISDIIDINQEFQKPDEENFRETLQGNAVFVSNPLINKTSVMIKLNNLIDTYLYISRNIDNDILNYLKETEEAVNFYYTVENSQTGIKITFAIIYIIVVTLLLFISTVIAISFARRLTKPMINLITASENISKGEFNTKVPLIEADEEIKMLNTTFNNMIQRLKRQQQRLIITERHSAWETVARKLAHEIKNPLTPIQLAIDRLRQKYSEKIGKQNSDFEDYLQTINRQIKDIENLINEFSHFARMPRPIFKKIRISEIISRAIQFYKMSYKNTINLKKNEKSFTINGDDEQLYRVFINLFKNSEESFNEIKIKKPDFKGKIDIDISDNNDYIVVCIKDNGSGIRDINKAMNPYFTTKKNGTGLGLPIVDKIINEHKGDFSIKNMSNNDGTEINISFPKI